MKKRRYYNETGFKYRIKMEKMSKKGVVMKKYSDKNALFAKIYNTRHKNVESKHQNLTETIMLGRTVKRTRKRSK